MGKKITFEEVEKKWLNLEWRDDNTFHLYIDNPFCFKKCSFCIYDPTVTRIGSSLYNDYYDFLLSEIKKYEKIINSRQLDSVYFGGGTASYMSTDLMRKVFDAIPGFKNIPHVDFEAHPAFISKGKIDILEEYNVNYLSFGIQSFDKGFIDVNNRITQDPVKIREKIDYAKRKGLFVNCDLLAFINTGGIEDLETFEDDLYKMSELLNPDSITIFPMYQRLIIDYNIHDEEINHYSGKEEEEHNFNLIYPLRKIMAKFVKRSKYYDETGTLKLSRRDILEKAKINYFLCNNSVDIDTVKRIAPYSSSGYPHQPDHQNTIAIGGYGERQPYSYFGRRFLYKNKVDRYFNVGYEVTLENGREV